MIERGNVDLLTVKLFLVDASGSRSRVVVAEHTVGLELVFERDRIKMLCYELHELRVACLIVAVAGSHDGILTEAVLACDNRTKIGDVGMDFVRSE